jgi:hypothetical protein
MRSNLLLALVTLSLGALSNSCAKNATEPTPTSEGPLAVSVKVGQTQAAGPLAVKLVSIQDHRCARENCARCIGGYATVQVDVTAANQASQRLTFRRLSCFGPDDFTLASSDSLRADIHVAAGYRIGLINMTDLVLANKLPTSDYAVKFLLQKD